MLSIHPVLSLNACALLFLKQSWSVICMHLVCQQYLSCCIFSFHTFTLLWSQVSSISSGSSVAGHLETEAPTPASDVAAPKAGSLDILWGSQICLPVNSLDSSSKQVLIVLIAKQPFLCKSHLQS